MPAGKNSSGGVKFANISRGRILISRGKDQPKDEVDFIEGALTDISIDQDTYQNDTFDRLALTIDDGQDRYILQMRLDSGYGRAVASALPNADFSKWIKFTPTYKDDKAGMFLNHGRTPIKWLYTREHPNGLPPLKEVIFKGKKSYDNTEQVAFFKDLLLNKIKPQLSHGVVSGPATPLVTEEANASNDTIIDDLPF